MHSYYEMQGADKASYEAVRGWDPDELAKRSRGMLGWAAKEYADVSDFLRVADMEAQAKLFANPDLGIGKPASEIASEDIDGNLLKLGDYKGRVVMLFFWGDWCQASRAVCPVVLSLVKKMEGRPFIVLGVNSDGDKGKLRQRIKDDNINWRSWWDGGGDHGPIARKFSIPGWPTIYILDHHHIIRHKFLGLPADDEDFSIAKVLDELTSAAIKQSLSSTPTTK
jgi:thiol-disulfide isomerase/thioredoxin